MQQCTRTCSIRSRAAATRPARAYSRAARSYCPAARKASAALGGGACKFVCEHCECRGRRAQGEACTSKCWGSVSMHTCKLTTPHRVCSAGSPPAVARGRRDVIHDPKPHHAPHPNTQTHPLDTIKHTQPLTVSAVRGRPPPRRRPWPPQYRPRPQTAPRPARSQARDLGGRPCGTAAQHPRGCLRVLCVCVCDAVVFDFIGTEQQPSRTECRQASVSSSSLGFQQRLALVEATVSKLPQPCTVATHPLRAGGRPPPASRAAVPAAPAPAAPC